MPYTIQSPSHGDIHLSDEIPDQFAELAKPGSGALSAVESFGDFLIQRYEATDFRMHWDYCFPKEAITVNDSIEGPCFYIVIVMNGSVTQVAEGIGDIELRSWQFYMAYFPQKTILSSFYKPGKGGHIFTLRLSLNRVKQLDRSFPFRDEFYKIISKQQNTLFPGLPGRITYPVFSIVNALLNFKLEEGLKRYWYDLKTDELLMLLTLDTFKAETPAINNKDLEAVMKTKQLIEENTCKPLSSRQLAVRVHMADHRLKRLFREVMDQSINEYTISTRLEYARQLLHDKEKSIKEIAGMCGYLSTDSFTTAFRKRYLVTPDALRKTFI